MKIDETWSIEVLRVVVFRSGGHSSLPGEAGKRDQGVVAPFQERLVNERRWVPACW